jgi:hypothetical protein
MSAVITTLFISAYQTESGQRVNIHATTLDRIVGSFLLRVCQMRLAGSVPDR